MSLDVQTQPKTKANFWHACRYLAPHRRLVIISIVCALIVGLAFTSGLGTMLPILQVLIKGDSVQVWIDRQIVEKRLDVTMLEDPAKVRIVRLEADAPKGLAEDDEIVAVENAVGFSAPASVQEAKTHTRAILGELAGPQIQSATVVTKAGRAAAVRLRPVSWYLGVARGLAYRLPTDPLWSIAAVFGILSGIAIFGNGMRFFQEYFSDKAAILAVNDIRRKLYDHVLHLPLSYFSLTGTSDVTSRLTQDSTTLLDGFKTILGKAIQEPIKAAMAFAFALFINWQLTVFIVLFAPIMFVLIRKFGKKMRRASRKAMQSSAVMLGHLEGTLIGIRVVKANSAERFERRRYSKIMQGLIDESLKMSRIDAMSSPILESMTMLVSGAIVLYAAYLVLRLETLSAGDFITVMICLVGIGESLRRCSKVNSHLQRSNSAAARIFETLSVPIERPRRGAEVGSDAVGGDAVKTRSETASRRHGVTASPLKNLPPIQREVRFENVTFAYPNSPTAALSEINLTVPKGRCVAIVGRNGSGKTTLAALLPRFYDPQRGRVLIDGTDLRSITLRSLRRQISVVTQDSVIFPGTIADNIAYGHPRATRPQVIDAAKRAFAHDFILEKPSGYDTVLGEMGGQLSGGQRQRLNIARAILRASPILILDEATSQVDAESEHLIQQAIESLMHQRTTFVIAHRFSTITSADEIIVLDRGRIVGQGQHEELLQNCSTYAQLYERQLVTAGT